MTKLLRNKVEGKNIKTILKRTVMGDRPNIDIDILTSTYIREIRKELNYELTNHNIFIEPALLTYLYLRYKGITTLYSLELFEEKKGSFNTIDGIIHVNDDDPMSDTVKTLLRHSTIVLNSSNVVFKDKSIIGKMAKDVISGNYDYTVNPFDIVLKRIEEREIIDFD